MASVVVNYSAGLVIDAQLHEPRRKLALALGLSINLLALFFFKYAGFVCTSVLGERGATWVTPSRRGR